MKAVSCVRFAVLPIVVVVLGVSQKWRYRTRFNMFRFAACLLLGFALSTAQGATLVSIDHDGTSADEDSPFGTSVLSQGTDWTYTTDGARSIMTALDNATSGNNRLIVVGKDGVTEFNAGGGPAGKGWFFEIELEILQGQASGGGVPFALFGVRSENEAGKQVWVGLSNDGGTGDLGRIGFINGSATFYTGSTEDLNVDGLIADGQYHNFKIYKYDSGGTTTVDVFMDGSLVLTRAYSTLVDDGTATDVQGFVSGTPVPLSEVNIDFINFTLYDNLDESIPALYSGTVAYWQLDETSGDLVDVVTLDGAAQTLTGQVALTYSQPNVAPNPITNPDAGPFTSGTTDDNPNSIGFNGLTAAPRTSGSARFKITGGSSFTFEGWLLHNISDGSHAAYEYIAGDRHITTSYKGWHVVVSSGKVQMYCDGLSATSTSRVDDGNPHHFAAVWDHAGAEMRIYLDGSLEDSQSLTPSSYTQAAFSLGARTTGGGTYNNNPLNGQLDELRFSNVALSPSEFLSASGPDTDPPQIATLSPTNNATGVPPGANLVATFDEVIVTNTTGSIVITNLTDNTATTIAVGDTSQVTVSGATLTINPTDDLGHNTPYAVLIDTNALKDSAGNFFAGITNVTTWAFETAPPAVLLHNWTFDADLTDSIGGKDATASGDAHFQAASSKIGAGSAVFDGAGDYMLAGTTGDFVIGSGTVSVSFWFRVTTAEASDRLLGTGAGNNTQDGWVFFMDTTAPDRIGPSMSDGGGRTIQKGNANGASDVGDGSWHLVAAVFDTTADTVTTYVDSVLETTIAMDVLIGGATGAVNNDYPLTFGASPQIPTGLSFHGYLDDVAIWDGTLSQADIDGLWNSGDGFPAVLPSQGTLFIIR
jgi:hypothetical protein